MQLIPNAKAQFIDSAGQPLASGTVGFYFPGSLNPKPTYQDAAGTIANTNPVQLDSRGQALIWGSGVYRQIVKDASGVTIWDQITEDPNAGLTGDITDAKFVAGVDFTPGITTSLTLPAAPGASTNMWIFFDAAYQADDQILSLVGTMLTFVSPIPVGVQEVNIKIGTTAAVGIPSGGSVTDATVAAGANIDSAKLSFLQAGAGALRRTVQSRLRDLVSVKDFGAKGDGVTDDTAAINLAINSGATGILYFPPGTYITTGNHTLQTGQYVVGPGKNVAVISNSSTINDTFKIASSFCGIADLTITGTTGRTAGIHVNAAGAPSHTYIARLSIFNFADAGVKLDGVVQYMQDLDISKPTISTGSGIIVSGGNDQYIRGITFDGMVGGVGPTQCFAGFHATQSGGVWLHDSDFIHAQNGVLMDATNSVVQFMFFDNVACDTCSNNGWNIATSGTGRVNDCAFNGCWGASSTNSGLLVTGVANSINGLSFSNSRFIGNNADGVYLQSGCLNVAFTGGLVSGNSLSPTLTASGIHVGANIGDVMVSGMRIGPSGSASDTQLVGILVDAGTGNRISITGCDLQTANTPLNMQATGANNTIIGCTGVTLKGQVSTTTDSNGHVVVTHNNGTALRTIFASVQNDATGILVQPSGISTTTNFQLKFFSAGGAALTNTAVTFNWLADF